MWEERRAEGLCTKGGGGLVGWRSSVVTELIGCSTLSAVGHLYWRDS